MSRFKPQVLLLQRSGNVHSLYSGSIDQPAESDKIAHGSKAQEGDVSLRMRWFRDHIRQGSWLALVAIAINFAVAFGHVHALDGTASERGPAALLASTTSSDGDQTQNHPADRTDYLCPICMAAAAMGT